MTTLDSILTIASNLDDDQIESLLKALEEILMLSASHSKISNEVKESRFDKGKLCHQFFNCQQIS